MNYVALLAAAIASTIVGMLWYTVIFGKMWMRLMGISKEKMEEMKRRGMGQTYAMNFIATLVMGYVLAQFTVGWNVANAADALQLAFWVWLGFIATTMIGSVLWDRKPVKLYMINVLFQLVSVSIMAVILAMWR